MKTQTDNTTIWVTRDTHNRLVWIKLRSKAKDLNAVIFKLIRDQK